MGRFEHTEPIFEKLNILKLNDIRKLEMSKLVFGDLDFCRVFDLQTRANVHSYNTRNNASFELPNPRLNLLRSSVFYEGLKYFDQIPTRIKNVISKDTFKIRLKSYLILSYSNE